MKKTYGVTIKEKRKKIPPVTLNLSGEEGRQAVMEAAKRVMIKHADVIKALGKR